MLLTDAHTHRIPPGNDRIALVNRSPDDRPEPPRSGIFFSCGIHPEDADRFSLDELRSSLAAHSAVAVGECGLDARLIIAPDRQEQVFRAQVELAEELELPVVIHSVRRSYELIRIRKECRARMPWLIHGFRDRREVGEAWLKTGCLLSLSPVWLRHQTVFPDWLPTDSFLLETDESEVPPAELYDRAAHLLGWTPEELARRLLDTFGGWIRQTL